jgi:16S rRNA A1518/A1519 N6-dimethyltransferase RsmA/KsgA/DIM1 with predicted DNA glycosylase/AP lyase activity
MNFGMVVTDPWPEFVTHKSSKNHEVRKVSYFDSEPQGKIIGMYTQKERGHKIAKYKEKLRKWKSLNKHAFNGRSRVAKKKLRYFGRFIKSEDFLNKIVSDSQIIKNNTVLEEATAMSDFNKLVDLITQDPSGI